MPGFVDLQVNGFKDVDFSSADLTREAAAEASRKLIAAGTAAFLPTMITAPLPVFQRNLGILSDLVRSPEFAGRLPGLHLEGPFLSGEPGAIGAHNPEWVMAPDIKVLENLQEWAEGTIRVITIAAEPEGADELCRHARKMGISVFLGHQLALEADLERLAKAGAVALTHLGNGLPATISRHHNPIWAGLANDQLMATFIADGHHLPPSVLKVMLRAKGLEHSVVVSDSSPLAGMPPGAYHSMGNDVVLESEGRLFNPGSGYLVGSSYTLLQCANVLLANKISTVEEVITLCHANPMRLIGLDTTRVPDQPLIGFNEEQGFFFPLAPDGP